MPSDNPSFFEMCYKIKYFTPWMSASCASLNCTIGNNSFRKHPEINDKPSTDIPHPTIRPPEQSLLRTRTTTILFIYTQHTCLSDETLPYSFPEKLEQKGPWKSARNTTTRPNLVQLAPRTSSTARKGAKAVQNSTQQPIVSRKYRTNTNPFSSQSFSQRQNLALCAPRNHCIAIGAPRLLNEKYQYSFCGQAEI